MASTAAKALLRANLGYPDETSVPAGLVQMMENDLDTAQADLLRDGIELDLSKAGDLNLLVMYATWLWRKRATGEGKGRMLREAINDRKVAKATEAPT